MHTWLESFFPVRTGDGPVLGVAAIARDVSRVRALQDELAPLPRRGRRAVQVVEEVPLVEERGLRGVEVLGARVAERPAAEADDAAALVVGGATTTAVKELVARDRPPFTDLPREVAGTDYSMPSGHALTGVLGLGLLLVLSWPALRERGWTRAAVAVAVVLGVVVCADRLVLGVHHLTDVLVGAGLGAAGAAAVARWGAGRG